jgi:integrase
MLLAAENNPRGYRDRALILLAYDSLCRRGELTSIRLEDIEFNNAGFPLLLKIQKSKTDQEASGKIIRLSDATSKAIKDWIECVQLIEGYLFRGLRNNGDILAKIKPSQINRIYKKLASRTSLPDDQIKNISGHSFRVGGAQDLLASGATLPLIMVKGRWSKPDTAMRYVEYVDPCVSSG